MEGLVLTKNEKKAHRPRKSGAKAEKKKEKKKKKAGNPSDRHNPRAFSVSKIGKTKKNVQRNLDRAQKKEYAPLVDRTEDTPPPIVVVVMGPPGCGKTTLIRSLVKLYTNQKLSEVTGPITVVSGKKRRLTFFECPNDLSGMVDLSKIADLVLLMVDASYGFEMETFEFLNILQVHGFPKVMGVLTHLDKMKNNKALSKTKKALKHRFWTEIYQGAKMFYLSGIINGKYLKNEIRNLSLFIARTKFRPLIWRNTHPYILVDRYEDITHPNKIHEDPNVSRTVCMYGYVRGTHLKKEMRVHLIGAGDFNMEELSCLADPCPLPKTSDGEVKKSLSQKDQLLYSPFSNAGNVLIDKDAVYIDIGQVNYTKAEALDPASKEMGVAESESKQEGSAALLRDLQDVGAGLDEKMGGSSLKLFSKGPAYDVKDVADTSDSSDEEESDGDQKSIDDEASDDEDESETEDARQSTKKSQNSKPAERTEVVSDGRVRRRAVFLQDQDASVADGDSGSESDSEENEDLKGEAVSGDLKWKENLAEKAAQAFLERKSENQNLMAIVYGDKPAQVLADKQNDENEEQEEEDDFFFLKKKPEKESNEDPDRLDSFRVVFDGIDLDDWDQEGEDCPIEALRDKFVTGNWAAAGSTDNAEEDPLNDEDIYGDFEDLETGENFSTQNQDSGEDSDESETNTTSLDQADKDAKLREINALKKAASRAKQAEDEEEAAEEQEEEEEEKNEFLQLAKQAHLDQSEKNKAEFREEGEAQRIRLEGFRQGLYVRVQFDAIPAEFVKNFNPKAPVIIGGLLGHETNLGLIQARVKKHRWHEKILKTNDPLVFSIGWRRFQSIPLYSIEDQNDRQRYLKYTPEHMHCHATFYAPLCPANTGILAFQTLNKSLAGFRISMTGVGLELDASFDVVKKLKLVGTPLKIFKNTAFIQGMFNSELEAAKFEGASIRTVSGVRGMIKKALTNTGPSGTFRATFEDKILMSDIVFCRTWVPVEPKKFYNPLTNLLEGGESQHWEKDRMKTVGELRREMNIPTPVNQDSLYKEIERQPRTFNKLRIPNSVQAKLPFASKPKLRTKKKKKGYMERRAVVMEPEERKKVALMQALNTIRNEKVQKRKEANQKRKQEYLKKKSKTDEFFSPFQKLQKKRIYRAQGKELARKRKRESA